MNGITDGKEGQPGKVYVMNQRSVNDWVGVCYDWLELSTPPS